MPSVISHNLLAMQVYNTITGEQMITDINNAAFLLGGLGPDFFYSSKSEKIAKLGSLFHHSNAEKTLQTLLDISSEMDTSASSFALGFLTHYALDSIVHPFVLATVNEMLPDCRRATDYTLHDKIESNLDTIILRDKTGQIPSEVSLKDFIPQDRDFLLPIAKLLSLAIDNLFTCRIDPQQIIDTYIGYRKFLSKYQDNTGMKRPFYRHLENLRNIPPIHSSRIRSIMEDDDYDYSNNSKSTWKHNKLKSNLSFFEMFDNAADLSKDLINAAIKKQPLTPLIGDKGFI